MMTPAMESTIQALLAPSKGILAFGLVVVSWILFHFIAWKYPPAMRHLYRALTGLFDWNVLSRLEPNERYTKKDISPSFWPNGKMPASDKWKQLAANGFYDFKLKIGGLVEKPIELSLEELRALGKEEYISMHHASRGGRESHNGVDFHSSV
jgi:sulfoxide reductase catalytic subunit YedY